MRGEFRAQPQHTTGGGRWLLFLLGFICSEEKCNDSGIVSRIYLCKLIYIRQRHPNTNRVTRQIAMLQNPANLILTGTDSKMQIVLWELWSAVLKHTQKQFTVKPQTLEEKKLRTSQLFLIVSVVKFREKSWLKMLKRELNMLKQLTATNGSPTDSLINSDCV